MDLLKILIETIVFLDINIEKNYNICVYDTKLTKFVMKPNNKE